MTASPNSSPIFIRNIGIIGQPVMLTNQTCFRDVPGNTPVIIYDPTASYALGNGALVESIQASATGITAASCLMIFYRITDETQPLWRKAFEVSLPAVSAGVLDSAIAGYPVEVPLPKLNFPVAHAGNNPNITGLRINPNDRPIEWGAALSVAVGTSPVIVTMYGGEY